jgi:HAD superfamily hydrolase (TIGR01662 family)
MISVIFDLDETLVDTTPAMMELKEENWKGAEHHISEFTLYEGVTELLEFLQAHDVRMAVVSTSPGEYCRMVLEHVGINCHCIIGKEEGNKPSPAPLLKALESLKLSPEHSIVFGDKATDIEAAQNAGIPSVACTWGTLEIDKLLNAHPDFVISDPRDGIQVLSKRFML